MLFGSSKENNTINSQRMATDTVSMHVLQIIALSQRRRGRQLFLLCLLLSFFLPTQYLVAQSRIRIPERDGSQGNITPSYSLPPLTVTAWAIDLNPRPTKDNPALMRELYNRARLRLSAMLYGYQFRYTLPNSERGISEEFEVRLLQEIPQNTRLEIVSTWEQSKQLHGQFIYRPSNDGLRWLSAWNNSPTITGGGRGEVGLWNDEDEQEAAVRNALLDAVRRYVKHNYVNQPRAVTGMLLVRDGPRVWIRSGRYYAELFTRIRINEVENYELY